LSSSGDELPTIDLRFDDLRFDLRFCDAFFHPLLRKRGRRKKGVPVLSFFLFGQRARPFGPLFSVN
jgi:hypothetical protein